MWADLPQPSSLFCLCANCKVTRGVHRGKFEPGNLPPCRRIAMTRMIREIPQIGDGDRMLPSTIISANLVLLPAGRSAARRPAALQSGRAPRGEG